MVLNRRFRSVPDNSWQISRENERDPFFSCCSRSDNVAWLVPPLWIHTACTHMPALLQKTTGCIASCTPFICLMPSLLHLCFLLLPMKQQMPAKKMCQQVKFIGVSWPTQKREPQASPKGDIFLPRHDPPEYAVIHSHLSSPETPGIFLIGIRVWSSRLGTVISDEGHNT